MKKLCLGTVQLGLKYGINNELGRQPTKTESFAILQGALDSGIQYFDTASVYGNAEIVLGDFGLFQRGARVISKLPANIADNENDVMTACIESLRCLKADKLDGYLFHDAKDLYRGKICQGMVKVKEEGLVDNIGVSVYESDDALYAVERSEIDYIQVPYNVLDQRLDECDFFVQAKKNGKKVFARSAFLQGLLLMDYAKIPTGVAGAKPLVKRFEQIAKRHHFSRLEASILFSYCHYGIDYVVFGVDTLRQLEQIMEVIKKADRFKTCFNELHGLFRGIERKIIIPSLW